MAVEMRGRTCDEASEQASLTVIGERVDGGDISEKGVVG